MNRRSMFAGVAPRLIIRTNGSVSIQGGDGEHVIAEAGPQQAVLLKRRAGGLEIQLSGDGQVLAPYNSRVELYCGSSATITHISGPVSAVASHNLVLRQVRVLSQASAGWSLEIDCQMVEGSDKRFTAGHDLHCRISALDHVRYTVDDQNGRWEQTLGDGRVQVRLKAGGDVRLLARENL